MELQGSGAIRHDSRASAGRVILESEADTSSVCRAAQDLARAEVPPDVIALLRMGRLTALQKPASGVRGIVCGDIVRKLVARTVAQSMSAAVQPATSPFQYALTTKSGRVCCTCNSVSH